MKDRRDKSKRRLVPRTVIEIERGQALVVLVLALVALIGFTALAIDGGNAYLVRRNMQNAADGAVVAGVNAFFDTKKYGGNAEASILQAANTSAERNGVEDTDPDPCVNDNVFVWYIDDNGDVIEPSTGTVQVGLSPDIHDATAMTFRVTAANCGAAGSAPDFTGLHVTTRRQFNTFFAQIVERSQMVAEGSAAVIFRYDSNTCAGEYAMLGFDERSQGTVKLTGEPPPNCVEIDGDVYSADEIHFGGGGCMRIDGALYHVSGYHISGGMDIWIGPIDEAGGAIDDTNFCDSAPDPSKWRFDDTSVGSGVEFCIYDNGAYDPFLIMIPPIEDPYNLDFNDWDLKNGGAAAYEAAGCWSTTDVGCYQGLVDIGGSTWEHWGDDYYYYADSGDWQITGTTAASPVPRGIYFLPNDGVQSTGTAYIGVEVTIAAGEPILLNGTYYLSPAMDLDGNPNSWKPYNGPNGYGVWLYGNYDNGSTNGNAIVVSGVEGDTEGLIYAPRGDCQFSGSGLHSGGVICEFIDSSGSTPSVAFNFGYCPPPRPTVVLAE